MHTKPAHSERDLARYGHPGDRIPGSALLRAYCAVCGEPIRVARLDRINECDDCRGLLRDRVLEQPRALRTQTRGPVEGHRP